MYGDLAGGLADRYTVVTYDQRKPLAQPPDPVDAEPPRERMRKDVREFIRRLEAVGLTVEPTPGHYRVLPRST
jgi:hypothetical protein